MISRFENCATNCLPGQCSSASAISLASQQTLRAHLPVSFHQLPDDGCFLPQSRSPEGQFVPLVMHCSPFSGAPHDSVGLPQKIYSPFGYTYIVRSLHFQADMGDCSHPNIRKCLYLHLKYCDCLSWWVTKQHHILLFGEVDHILTLSLQLLTPSLNCISERSTTHPFQIHYNR